MDNCTIPGKFVKGRTRYSKVFVYLQDSRNSVGASHRQFGCFLCDPWSTDRSDPAQLFEMTEDLLMNLSHLLFCFFPYIMSNFRLSRKRNINHAGPFPEKFALRSPSFRGHDMIRRPGPCSDAMGCRNVSLTYMCMTPKKSPLPPFIKGGNHIFLG
jgi:hypothetical protein